MVDIPKFALYGDGDPQIEESIQPRLDIREWGDLGIDEKKIALQQIQNMRWLRDDSANVLSAITYMNDAFLRQCPGKRLHAITPDFDFQGRRNNENEIRRAAYLDFCDIFVGEKSESMVLRMLSHFAKSYINEDYLRSAEISEDIETKSKNIEQAYSKFDFLGNCLNHVFDQFSINIQLTRNGLIPKQDEKITKDIYEPTLKMLADPKWKTVSDNLAQMFSDYTEGDYPEVITKAHSSVQRFLQVLVGEEGKSGKGEVGKLFGKAKEAGILPIDRFTEPVINVLQGFIVSERANNSTAKPAIKDATSEEALLIMNVVMVFLQHCLLCSK